MSDSASPRPIDLPVFFAQRSPVEQTIGGPATLADTPKREAHVTIDPTIGGPATLGDAARATVNRALTTLRVDEASLNGCLQAAKSLVLAAKERSGVDGLTLDTLSMELGVSATGKVGFLGSGADVQVAAKIQFTFKVC